MVPILDRLVPEPYPLVQKLEAAGAKSNTVCSGFDEAGGDQRPVSFSCAMDAH